MMDAHEESIKAAAIAMAGLGWVGASPAERAVWMDHAKHAVRAYLTKRRQTDGAVLTTTPRLYPEPGMLTESQKEALVHQMRQTIEIKTGCDANGRCGVDCLCESAARAILSLELERLNNGTL